ncbi:MAG: acyltransferase family protein, partial [Phreatobacter sp.]
MTEPTPGPDARRIDLDWIRIAAFGLLILYHVGMLYVTWPF